MTKEKSNSKPTKAKAPRAPRKPKAVTVPRGDTPPVAIKMPSRVAETLLPLVDVGSVAFERLCSDVLKFAHGEVQSRSLKRTSGAQQFGVDIEGFDSQHEPTVVVSCKCYHKVLSKYLPVWVEDFTKHLDGHWRGKKIKHFVLAVTHEGNEDDINDVWRKQVGILKALGIAGHLWNSSDITDLLRKDSRLVVRYFNPVWADAIAASPSDSTPSVTLPKPSNSGVNHFVQLAAFAAQIDGAMRGKFEAALAESKSGRPAALEKCLEETIDDEGTWEVLNADTKARLLRTKAIAKLEHGDSTEARDLLGQADGYSAAPDRVARALVACAEGGIEDGLAFLDGPRTIREREIAAGWQIQLSDFDGAIETLGNVQGEDVGTEVLRLRAISEFCRGNRSQALRLAKASTIKAPAEAMPRLTLAICKMMASLSDTVEPQFGTVPNPISAALVRGTSDAKLLLNEAQAEFESLIATTNQPLRSDLEVWKFAALLLHPDKRAEARAFGQAMLRRIDPEPAIVAWALHYRISLRVGLLRKRYSDILRSRKGSPSHVAILALLTAHAKGAKAALAVIDQHAANFPEAYAFFEGWRMNLGGHGEMDQLSALVRAAINKNNFDPLVTHLKSNKIFAAELLQCSELLVSRKQWELLNGLRDKLMELNVERGFALAMLGALNCKAPKDAVDIASIASSAFQSGELPRNLVALRIRAQEDLGHHAPVITDLRSLLSESEDAELRRKLISTYLRIGAYPEVGTELERMLNEPSSDRRDVLALAHAVRSHSPDLARRAVLFVTEGGDVPGAEMASALLSLAAELGLAEIQNRMMPLVIASANEPSSPVRSFTEDELMEFIQQNIENSRTRYEKWLSGEVPAALALDQATFVRLLLSPDDQRYLPQGEMIPMLLRSPARDEANSQMLKARTPLRLDLSGLLMAERLGVTAELEATFAIELPPSIGEALGQMEGNFHKPDRAIIEVIRTVLSASSRTLKVVESISENAVSLNSKEDESEDQIDPQLLKSLMSQCFKEGHLSRDKLDAALALAGVDSLGDIDPDIAFEVLRLDPNTVVHIAKLGILQAVCTTFDVEISSDDVDVVERQIGSAEHNGELKDKLSATRQLVADRLKSGEWVTIPVSTEALEKPIDHLSPLMRCLMETLSGAGPDTLFWVEDRAISRSGNARFLDVFDILKVLESAGRLNEKRSSALRKSLREAGYCFAPLPVKSIVDDLALAPIDDNQVNETADLSAWRSWYAAETERLQYVQKVLHQDEQGRIAGELKRVLSLGGVARLALEQVWKLPDDIESKKARSEWIWTCLRAEQLPALGSSGDPSAKRQNAVLTLAHVLDLPFHLALNQSPMKAEEAKAFAEWFSSSVLDKAERVDPDLGDEVSSIIADMLNTVLQRDKELAVELDVEANQIFGKLVNDYLATLPFKWRSAIADKIAPEFNRTRVMVIGAGTGHTVTATEFCRAYSQAVMTSGPNPREVSVQMSSGKPARLKYEDHDGQPSVTLIMAKQQYEMDKVSLALAHPDLEQRKLFVSMIPEVSNAYSCIPIKDWEEAVSYEEIDTRFSSAAKLLELDLWRRLADLGQRFADGTPIYIHDLDLPRPGVVSRFLGSENQISEVDAIWKVHESLIAQVGIDEALLRFSAIPFQIAPNHLDTFRALAVGAKPLNAQDHPFIALLQQSFLARNGASVGSTPLSAADITLALQEGGVELFSSLVKFYGQAAAFRPDWQPLTAEVRVSLIWVYASAIMRAFNAPSSDLLRIASVIEGSLNHGLAEGIKAQAMGAWERRMTVEFSPIVVRAALIADLVSSQIPIDGSALSTLVGRRTEEAWTPDLDLLFPPPPSSAHDWAGRDAVPQFVRLGWTEQESNFSLRLPEDLVQNMLNSASSDDQPYVIPALLSVVDVDRVSAETLIRMRDTIDSADGEAFVEPDRLVMHRLLTARATVKGKLQETEAFRSDLTKIAGRCSSLWSSARLKFRPKIEGPGAAFAILEMAIMQHCSRLSTSPEAKADAVAELFESVVGAWPGSLRAVIASLDEHARHVTGYASNGVWDAALRIRRLKA